MPKTFKSVNTLILLDNIQNCNNLKEKAWGVVVCKANKKVRKTDRLRKRLLSKMRRNEMKRELFVQMV